MNKKEEEKRVIFLVNKLTGGGAERVVSNLSLNLPDRVKTTIALEENLVSYDYKGELISIRAPPPLRWMWKFYYVYRLIKLRKEKGVDVTISFIDAANFVNLLSDMISNQDDKIVISVRNYPSKRKSMITKGLMESFYHRADVIVVVSKLARWDLVDNFDQDEKKIKVIYNPCDVPRIREKAG